MRKNTIQEVVNLLVECSDDAFVDTLCTAFYERRTKLLDKLEAIENAGVEHHYLQLLLCFEMNDEEGNLVCYAAEMGQVGLSLDTAIEQHDECETP